MYARQSITREGSASLDVQVESCREAAKRLKVDVVAELIEAPSTSGYENRGIPIRPLLPGVSEHRRSGPGMAARADLPVRFRW